WIRQNNHQLSCTQFYLQETPPPLSEIDWLIVMGGPMGIYDDDRYPYLKAEKEYLKRAVAQNKTMLGICLGAQLLADVLGAAVNKGKHTEIGWFPIRKTEAGKSSGLIKLMPDEMPVFHWHGDQFEIPKNSVHLIESEACPNQAFLYNDNVLGLQFHFEATPESIHGMIEHVGDELVPDKFIQSDQEIRQQLSKCEQSNQVMFGLLDQLAYATN
ncbi:MAG TPA: type 1 glutamine amidotransferase, partial [Sunxiuqinia sp.]|nr:type 1 glutamine amidotransferase [Sunxiuqinia sp.]